MKLDLSTLNEDGVMALLESGQITEQEVDNYFQTTSIYGRLLRNNSVWNQIASDCLYEANGNASLASQGFSNIR